jgi:membrane-associated phospholipid phosphatase
MKKKLRFIVFAILLTPLIGLSQQTDTLINKLDSLSLKTDRAGGLKNNTNPKAYNENTKLTPSTYFILLASNLKQSFTKPFHMTGRDWGNTAKFAAIAGALAFADEPIQQRALQFRKDNPGFLSTSTFITNFGGAYEGYVLASFGAYGVVFKNEKMKTTTLLATQAYITGAAVETFFKVVSGRTRPSYYDPNVEAEPTFLGPFAKSSGARINSAFPSGHTTVAFAAATVFAMEYKHTPWIPILAYSSASIIGLSRITENKHWATDVFVAAALGYLTGRQIVNNYHRYAKLKAPKQKKSSVSFNLQYNNRVIMPGLIYKFR